MRVRAGFPLLVGLSGWLRPPRGCGGGETAREIPFSAAEARFSSQVETGAVMRRSPSDVDPGSRFRHGEAGQADPRPRSSAMDMREAWIRCNRSALGVRTGKSCAAVRIASFAPSGGVGPGAIRVSPVPATSHSGSDHPLWWRLSTTRLGRAVEKARSGRGAHRDLPRSRGLRDADAAGLGGDQAEGAARGRSGRRGDD